MLSTSQAPAASEYMYLWFLATFEPGCRVQTRVVRPQTAIWTEMDPFGAPDPQDGSPDN